MVLLVAVPRAPDLFPLLEVEELQSFQSARLGQQPEHLAVDKQQDPYPLVELRQLPLMLSELLENAQMRAELRHRIDEEVGGYKERLQEIPFETSVDV